MPPSLATLRSTSTFAALRALLAELADLTRAGYERYREAGYVA